jgi:hypothetical protein
MNLTVRVKHAYKHTDPDPAFQVNSDPETDPNPDTDPDTDPGF